MPGEPEPPPDIRLSLDEALDLLAAVEDSRDTLIESRHLTLVMDLEVQVSLLESRLGFGDQEEE